MANKTKITEARSARRGRAGAAGRPPGHRRATTTNRHVHLDDAAQSRATERVGVESERKLRGTG